jgi:hypothetical protein
MVKKALKRVTPQLVVSHQKNLDNWSNFSIIMMEITIAIILINKLRPVFNVLLSSFLIPHLS